MGVHPFSAFDTRAIQLSGARSDLWVWAEPIVVDRASDWYGQWINEPAGIWALARKHCRLWRMVIQDEPERVPAVSDDLRRAVVGYGFDSGAVNEVNEIILEELFDIVLCRYRASRATTKTYSLVLMSATSCLSAMRAAA